MLESVSNNGYKFEECKEILKNSYVVAHTHGFPLQLKMNLDIKLDPGFKGFYQWCKDNDVPVIIVSRSSYSATNYSC